MADRPIIFSAPMVWALLDERKTQTRRVLKPPYGTLEYLRDGTWRPICIKFFPGNRLYVREQCATWVGDLQHAVYRADATEEEWENLRHDAKLGLWKLRPSIHMPRWASRLTLTVTDVRAQRLQEISEGDARAEGAAPQLEDQPQAIPGMDGHRGDFRDLWNSIHGPGAWDANPWVCALTFTVHRCNIDQMPGVE
jgi:hypothetical protein